MKRQALDVVGLDIAHCRLEDIDTSITTVQADACHLPFTAESFDSVLCSDVLDVKYVNFTTVLKHRLGIGYYLDDILSSLQKGIPPLRYFAASVWVEVVKKEEQSAPISEGRKR